MPDNTLLRYSHPVAPSALAGLAAGRSDDRSGDGETDTDREERDPDPIADAPTEDMLKMPAKLIVGVGHLGSKIIAHLVERGIDDLLHVDEPVVSGRMTDDT